jgi:hypothetical protein
MEPRSRLGIGLQRAEKDGRVNAGREGIIDDTYPCDGRHGTAHHHGRHSSCQHGSEGRTKYAFLEPGDTRQQWKGEAAASLVCAGITSSCVLPTSSAGYWSPSLTCYIQAPPKRRDPSGVFFRLKSPLITIGLRGLKTAAMREDRICHGAFAGLTGLSFCRLSQRSRAVRGGKASPTELAAEITRPLQWSRWDFCQLGSSDT